MHKIQWTDKTWNVITGCTQKEFFNKKYCDLETKLRLKLEQELKEILSRYL